MGMLKKACNRFISKHNTHDYGTNTVNVRGKNREQNNTFRVCILEEAFSVNQFFL